MAKRKRERLSAGRWSEGAGPMWAELVAWREAHPKATLTEIEDELDRQMNQLRGRVLEDLAVASAAADVVGSGEERPRCARCGVVLQAQGQEERGVVTQGGVEMRLERSYATCPRCGDRSFPPGR